MRELKFRAWDEKYKHMVDFSNCKNGIEYNCGKLRVSTGWDSYDSPTYDGDDSHFKIMQYTGLKDVAGVEIFEGDIVEWRGDLKTQEMREKYGDDDSWPESVDGWIFEKKRDVATMARFPKYWLKNEEFGYEGEGLVDVDDCRVIGNIHENPELLEK